MNRNMDDMDSLEMPRESSGVAPYRNAPGRIRMGRHVHQARPDHLKQTLLRLP